MQVGIQGDQPAVDAFIAGIVFGGRVIIPWIGAFAAGQEKCPVAVDPIDDGRLEAHLTRQGNDFCAVGIVAGNRAKSQQGIFARPVNERGKVDLDVVAVTGGRHNPAPTGGRIAAGQGGVAYDGDIGQPLQGTGGHLAGDGFGRIAGLERRNI